MKQLPNSKYKMQRNKFKIVKILLSNLMTINGKKAFMNEAIFSTSQYFIVKFHLSLPIHSKSKLHIILENIEKLAISCKTLSIQSFENVSKIKYFLLLPKLYCKIAQISHYLPWEYCQILKVPKHFSTFCRSYKLTYTYVSNFRRNIVHIF